MDPSPRRRTRCRRRFGRPERAAGFDRSWPQSMAPAPRWPYPLPWRIPATRIRTCLRGVTSHLPGRCRVVRMRRRSLRGANVPSRPPRTFPKFLGRTDLDAGGGHMRIRSLGLSLFAGLSIIVAACGPGATPSPSAASQPPAASQPAASADASAGPSAPASQAATSDLKIGVVTDVGTAQRQELQRVHLRGRPGRRGRDRRRPSRQSSSRRSRPTTRRSIQSFVDQDFNVIVAAGFNLAPATVAARPRPTPTSGSSASTSARCINATGDVRIRTFADCSGDRHGSAAEVRRDQLPEDQAGYLAGIVAGRRATTKHDRRDRRRLAVRAVRALHPGLRARRQVGQARHQGRRAAYVVGQRLLGSASRTRRPARRSPSSFLTQNNGRRRPVPGRRPDRQRRPRRGVRGRTSAAIGVDVDQYQSYPPRRRAS